jgi:hypothetical protein
VHLGDRVDRQPVSGAELELAVVKEAHRSVRLYL